MEIHGWRLHAFVLMTNHEHLFVETPEANLSAGMQYLGGSYTSYFNRRHQRSGHLFQGRFKGHLIEEEGYFLEVSRYIHLNPVRAKMVDRLAMARIVSEVAPHFGHDPDQWRPGRRVDDASRALAAYLARRRFGYASREVAAALGYRGHGGVASAVVRFESASLAPVHCSPGVTRTW